MAMVKLRFNAMEPTKSIVLGPVEGFRVAGNFLRQLPDNTVVGEYSRHQWHVRDGHFARYDALSPCRIHFEDTYGARSEIFGPFADLHVADGTMYTADRLFAKFVDESLLWHCYDLENYWPNLVITGVI